MAETKTGNEPRIILTEEEFLNVLTQLGHLNESDKAEVDHDTYAERLFQARGLFALLAPRYAAPPRRGRKRKTPQLEVTR
jgi:hypothetical protein